MLKEEYKKYKKHSKELVLPSNFNPDADLEFLVIENAEVENRGFICDLFIPYLKGKSSYFNLGYMASTYIPNDLFHMSWNERSTLSLNERNVDGFKHYHIDKPKIDFMRVFEAYQRKGIAEQMILFAAKWYQENKGLNFYFSNLNNPEKMEPLKQKMIKKCSFVKAEDGDGYYSNKVRYYFDVKKKKINYNGRINF